MALGMLVAALMLVPSMLVGLWWIRNYKKSVLKEPPSVPLGARLRMVWSEGGVELLRLLTKVCYKFGKESGIFLIKTVHHPIFIITKAETAEILLSSSKNISKSVFYRFLVPWLGTGLLTSTGEKWYSRRKMLTPTFHFKILEDFLHIFNEQSTIMVDRLQSKTGRGRFDIMPNVTLCTLDIICDTAMGKNVNAQSNSDSEYVKAIYRISDIIMTRVKRPLQWPDFLFRLTASYREQQRCLRILHDFTEQVIRERRAALEASRKEDAQLVAAPKKDETEEEEGVMRMTRQRKRLAFLDLLLEMAHGSSSLTNEDLREEVDTFMFEGHDTTATAISWAIHLIGANPEVQTKLQEELDRIFGDSNRPVTMDDIRELRYMECAIKESLRLFPSVPLFARSVTEPCNIGGYIVPEHATAAIMTFMVHMDPKHFPDPQRYDPDRWLPENSVDRHPFAFIPFSAGPRNCIGQKFAMIEEKVLLTYIFREFQMTSLQAREELKPCGELILRPEEGVFVSMKSRRSGTAATS